VIVEYQFVDIILALLNFKVPILEAARLGTRLHYVYNRILVL